MSKVVVCRPVDGITINSEMEFLLDDEDCVRIFDNVEDAKKILSDAGCTDEEMEHMKFLESCGVCARCTSPLFPSLLPGYKYQCFTCDEDFYSFEAMKSEEVKPDEL